MQGLECRDAASSLSPDLSFLSGGGEMGRRIRAHEWSATQLGAPEHWPQALRFALGICLNSTFPTAIYWGPDLCLFYNDAWSPIPAEKHPWALGRPAREVWSDIWEIIEPQLTDVIANGRGFATFNQMLPMQRGDRIEETYWNYSFTPIRDETGAIVGVLNQGNETTLEVLTRRERQAEIERLRGLFEQAPGAVALLRGPTHIFEFTNRAYLELIGDRDVIGRVAREVLPEIVSQGFLELLDRAYATGEAVVGSSVPIRLRRADGEEERVLDFVFQPIKDAIGSVTHILAQATDVTKRVQAERALRAANEHQTFVFRLAEQQREMDSPESIMQFTADTLARRLHADRVGFFHVSDDGGIEFGPGWASAKLPPLMGRIAASDLGARLARIAGSGKPIAVNDTAADARIADSPFPLAGARAGIGVPLLRAGHWQSGLYVSQAEPRHWTHEEIALTEEVAQLAWDAVERAVVAQALRESEERLQMALSASNSIGIWDWDVVNDRLRADKRFAELYGVDPQIAARGAPLRDYLARIHPDDVPRLKVALDVALRTGERFAAEYRIVEDHAERWVVAQGRCTLAADGAPLRFPGVSFDVTDLKRAQAAEQSLSVHLAEERSRLRMLVENLPVGVCFLDAHGKAMLSNPAYRRFVPEGLVPSANADVAQRWVGRDERGRRVPREQYPVARALRGEFVPGAEFLYRSPEGEERWTRVSAAPVLNAEGKVGAVLTVIVDIDEQKRAQETLERLNQMLESEVQERTRERDRIWQVSEDLLGVADANGVWLSVNPAWTRSLGWEAEEILNKTSQWLESDSAESTHAHFLRLQEGETFSFESQLRARGGEPRMLSWRGVRIEGAIYSVARDVTEKRLRDAALAQAEEQLRQSRKMEAVGQLTGGIAHDFNNLLTGIIGSLDMMQTRIGQGRHDSVHRYAQAAVTSANRAAALTHRLLAFSRRQPLDPRPVAPNALIAGMEDMLRRTMGEKINLEIATGAGLWLTRCDANQLENAILNLAINARDAMPSGGRMTIETSNLTLTDEEILSFPGLKAGQYVCIAVTDTGVGMNEDVRAKAYEPFFTTKPIGQGTGLGLSMIYGFAKQSDGYTRIDSEPGVGTSVYIYLPRYLGEVAPPETESTPSGQFRAVQERTVLVVEDETVVRGLVMEVLSDLGFRAIEARDGRTGLDVLMSEEAIDLVITDVGLPEMNGRQMIERARQRRPGLKVLFITGYAENATFGQEQATPPAELITKPFSLEALSQRICEMLEEQRD